LVSKSTIGGFIFECKKLKSFTLKNKQKNMNLKTEAILGLSVFFILQKYKRESGIKWMDLI
jgi:hypothetical protein